MQQPNDLRNPNFQPNRPGNGQVNNGCAPVALLFGGFLLLLLGLGFLIVEGFPAAMVCIVVSIWMFSAAASMRKAARKTAAARPSPAAKVACPNPEPHRHYEQAAPCPNPEPHSHNRPAHAKRQYDTFVQPNRPAPTARERRLENMRNLYDAGLLTREEYDDEVRKLRS